MSMLFLNVCKLFKNEVMQLNAPITGIAPLRAAVHKIQISSEQLTPIHADYLLLCLLAKQYKAGLSVLEDDIFDVDQPKDLFLYCYYGGMIYIGLKKFPKALELLHNIPEASISKESKQFTYKDGSQLVFMDMIYFKSTDVFNE